MRKSEVYSWRLAPEFKQRLQSRAREERVGMSQLLEKIVREWLDRNREPDDEDQRRRHERAWNSIGSLAGSDPGRSRRVTQRVRESLARRRGSRS